MQNERIHIINLCSGMRNRNAVVNFLANKDNVIRHDFDPPTMERFVKRGEAVVYPTAFIKQKPDDKFKVNSYNFKDPQSSENVLTYVKELREREPKSRFLVINGLGSRAAPASFVKLFQNYESNDKFEFLHSCSCCQTLFNSALKEEELKGMHDFQGNTGCVTINNQSGPLDVERGRFGNIETACDYFNTIWERCWGGKHLRVEASTAILDSAIATPEIKNFITSERMKLAGQYKEFIDFASRKLNNMRQMQANRMGPDYKETIEDMIKISHKTLKQLERGSWEVLKNSNNIPNNELGLLSPISRLPYRDKLVNSEMKVRSAMKAVDAIVSNLQKYENMILHLSDTEKDNGRKEVEKTLLERVKLNGLDMESVNNNMHSEKHVRRPIKDKSEMAKLRERGNSR